MTTPMPKKPFVLFVALFIMSLYGGYSAGETPDNETETMPTSSAIPEAARTVTVAFWKTDDCSGDPMERGTITFPVDFGDDRCFSWPGHSGENSATDFKCGVNSLTYTQWTTTTCSGGVQPDGVRKTAYTDRCEQDNPPTLYSRIVDFSGCLDKDPQRLLSGDLEKKFLSDPEARCNDGTRATLYLRRSRSKRWIVALPGGEACTDKKSCGVYLGPHAKPADCGHYDPTPGTPDCTQPQPVHREKALLSSSCDAETRRGAGLLSPDPWINPDFHDANAVWLRYCSSDFWIGRKPAADQAEGIYFVGQTNLFASLKDLIEVHGMDQATEIMIVGNAASGAIALLWHGDRIAEYIRDNIDHPVEVQLVADSAWMLNQDLYPAFEGECRKTQPISCRFAETLQEAVKEEVYNPEVPEDCAAAGLSWQCLMAKVRVHDVPLQTPMFHAQYLYDVGQLGMASFPDARTATDGDWSWARSTVARPFRELFKDLDGLFAVSCYQHGFMTLDAWRDVTITSGDEEIDVSEALQRWLRWLEGQGQPAHFIDQDYEHVFCQDARDEKCEDAQDGECESAQDEKCNQTCKPCTYPPDPT